MGGRTAPPRAWFLRLCLHAETVSSVPGLVFRQKTEVTPFRKAKAENGAGETAQWLKSFLSSMKTSVLTSRTHADARWASRPRESGGSMMEDGS